MKKLNSEEVAVDAGLWTWLTLLFFDSVCPVAHGKRSVKNDYHYIFEPRNTEHCVAEEKLWEFLIASQPDTLQKLKDAYGTDEGTLHLL